MKKTVFKSLLILVVLGSASAAMAATSIFTSTTLGNGNSFSPSSKVGIELQSTTTQYSATACHINGTYEYGTVGGTNTAADVSKIYYKAIPSQTSSTTNGVPDSSYPSVGDLPGGYATWTGQ